MESEIYPPKKKKKKKKQHYKRECNLCDLTQI